LILRCTDLPAQSGVLTLKAELIGRLQGGDKHSDVTVSVKPVLCGTDLSITQSGIPEAIPLEMCYLGWQESLAQLATLVEPEIPG